MSLLPRYLIRSRPSIPSPSLSFRNRMLHTSRPLQAETRGPVDPPPAPAGAAPHTAIMDVVAGLAEGPVVPVEDASVVAAEVVSGAPHELQLRQVRIFKPTKSTMQSAKGKTKRWVLDWDVLQGAGRWENPLMGWASSADYMQGTTLGFRSKEAAISFAERQGWDYIVSEPKVAKIPPKNYANNYVHVPGKLRIHHTK
ncbi:ETC complex I subunit conserved region-domain-containing protein [Naematelia encephala]|uniref:NADH dehydrogenase [ubiquinone] iron-sulfur protein 4, mitochondrial n=1 Tax=Naematelia encephala TaxID=71784 RepID=A0A1Y2B0J5_9TREE|nr:ETC complex I subunit conserved region-domain-containing protein [Naematelia encephala]